MNTTRRTLLAVANAAGLLLVLVVNGLANALPLNGLGTGELSDFYPNLFVPMGLTFSIWGLIYLGLLAQVGYGFVMAREQPTPDPLSQIGPWFVVNCLANAAWIFAWHWQQVPLSLVLMGVILASLVVMFQRLGVGQWGPGQAPASTAQRWLVHAPISLYLGWITVATVANVTTLAVDMGVPAFGPGPAWVTVAVLGVVVAITGRMLWARHDLVYAGVVLWALLGIFLKRSAAEEAGSGLVSSAALLCLVVVAVAMAASWVRRRKSFPPQGGEAATTGP